MRVIGLISGTSLDGIDVAAADLHVDGDELGLCPLGHLVVAYDDHLRRAIQAALPPAETTAGHICRLHAEIGRAFADAAAGAVAELAGGAADLIVSHGQTLFHDDDGRRVRGTLQVGQPAWIAERTGLPVVADLRSRDVSAGGRGAPLVSLVDVLLLGGEHGSRAALNLGGIANLTVVSDRAEPLAFDVGPGNALIDAAVAHYTGGEQTMDTGGRWAARGGVHRQLLDRLLADPYYDRPPPRSTGKERFNRSYLLAHVRAVDDPAPADVVATVTALTAETVARACRRHGVERLMTAGGGTRNPTLMRLLAAALPEVDLTLSDTVGIPAQAKEAYAFAVLGFLTVHGIPGTAATCTGADHPTVLGCIVPGATPLVLPAAGGMRPARLRVRAGERR